ncbi:MAG: PAS domain-containing sensor histidine kinase, partial [Chitinophagaceae bacterium]
FIYQPLREPDGTITGIMVVASDVTPQVLAKNDIAEAEENSRLAIEAADLGSYTIDLETGMMNTTDRFVELFGFKPSDQIMHKDIINTIHPDFADIRQKAHDEAAITGFLSYEAKFSGPDKKTRWLKLSGKFFFNNEKKPIRVLGIAMDTTEQRELQQRKDDFIRMASHELKTPVTSIKGYVQLLLSMMDKKDQATIPTAIVQSSLLSVDKQVLKLTRLMSELLDLSRIESGKLDLSNEFFGLNELVADVAQDILYTNTKHKISVTHDFDAVICGDKDRLAQVFINVINNAIKYSPTIEEVEIRIYEESNGYVAVSVKDYGIGIAEANHDRIFERFFRAEGKSEQTYPGFGIGLFIAKDIIERHHGSIRVNSEKDKGSEFIIVLPVPAKKIN